MKRIYVASTSRNGFPLAAVAVVAILATALGFGSVPRQVAFGQTTPTLTLSPSSGPCDATITVNLSGFNPGETVPLDIGTPHSGALEARLEPAITDANGSYSGSRTLGEGGCSAATKESRFTSDPVKSIVIAAGVDLRTQSLKARADYLYTTTIASTKTETVSATAEGATPIPSPTSANTGSGGTSTARWLIALAVAGGLVVVLLGVILLMRQRS